MPIALKGYLMCEPFRTKGAIAGTSLRTYDEDDFNMSYSNAVSKEAYGKNLKRWLGDFRLQDHYDKGRIFFAHLIHGSNVLNVTESETKSHRSDRFVQRCDGFITDRFGAESVVLTVKTADCLPIFLFDPKTKASGIVHCGWRGLKQGALLNALDAIKSLSTIDDLMLHIGPGISAARYEVGEDVAKLFPESVSKRGNSWFLDLADAAIRQAMSCGLRKANISFSGHCTYEQSDMFFSLRREGKGGTMLSFITVPN